MTPPALPPPQVEESPIYRSWNLTILEVTYYVLSSHTPASLYALPAAETAAAAAAATAAAAAPAAAPAAEADRTDGLGNAAVETEGGGAADADARGAEAGPATPRTTTRRPGSLGGMMMDKKAQRQALLTHQSARHGRFGGAFKVRSDFGTQHVLGRLNSSGECQLPEAKRKRTAKAKMPISQEAPPRSNKQSEAAVRKFATSLALGSFNSLASTVVKDLEGFAFGSTANNASKVLPQDHTFFAAVAAWFLESHLLQQDAERVAKPELVLDVAPVGSLAEVGVFQLALRDCYEIAVWLPRDCHAIAM